MDELEIRCRLRALADLVEAGEPSIDSKAASMGISLRSYLQGVPPHGGPKIVMIDEAPVGRRHLERCGVCGAEIPDGLEVVEDTGAPDFWPVGLCCSAPAPSGAA